MIPFMHSKMISLRTILKFEKINVNGLTNRMNDKYARLTMEIVM